MARPGELGMISTLRTAHLVVGAITLVAFIITGQIMSLLDPPVAAMEWGDRMLFRSRYIYMLCAALVNLAVGVHFGLPEGGLQRNAAILGSLMVLASAVLLFFAFFVEPMAGRPPGPVSSVGLSALFAGVLLYTTVNLKRAAGRSA